MKTRTLFVMLASALLVVFSAGSAFAGNPFKLIYYDGHMHTTRSDGTGEVSDIKTTALARGLDAVIITDHCKSLTQVNWASLVAQAEAASDCPDPEDCNFLVLPGFEVTGSDGMLNRDHIIALGVDDPFVGDDSLERCPEEVWESPPNSAGTGPLYPENLAKWVDYIHKNHGIAVHNHPSGSTQLSYGVNNLEVYNQGHVDDISSYASQLGYSPEEAWQFGIMLNNLAVTGESDANVHMLIDNPLPSPPFPPLPSQIAVRDVVFWATLAFSGTGQWLGAPEAPLNSWDDLLMAYVDGAVDTPIFGLANSDAHNTKDIEGSKVGSAKNGAYVKKLNAKELYKAIKAGRTFATTGPSLSLCVNGENMGDTAFIFDGTANIKLTANSEAMTAILVKIDVIKDGALWYSTSPVAPTVNLTLADNDVTEDGYYRVEVTSYDVVSETYQFAWSNPVFVDIP